MAGFLDPTFPARNPTDFRVVLDRVLARLRPERAYLYGTKITPVEATLGVLGAERLYADNNTNMELAFDSIAADNRASMSYLILGDGRRGSPTVASGQYTRMRELAQQWIDRGGMFVVAASRASFKKPAGDPSGCATEPDVRSTCPLYAFVFAAPGDELRIAGALADVFEHLFVWPLAAIPSAELSLVTRSSDDMLIEHRWKPSLNGHRILRARSRAAPNRVVPGTLALSDSLSPAGRAKTAFLRGQAFRQQISAKPLTLAAASQPWTTVTRAGAQVRSSGDGLAIELLTKTAEGPRSIYRIDLVPTGAPSWIGDFDAPDSGDRVRTFGLATLFRAFENVRDHAAPAARFYIVAN